MAYYTIPYYTILVYHTIPGDVSYGPKIGLSTCHRLKTSCMDAWHNLWREEVFERNHFQLYVSSSWFFAWLFKLFGFGTYLDCWWGILDMWCFELMWSKEERKNKQILFCTWAGVNISFFVRALILRTDTSVSIKPNSNFVNQVHLLIGYLGLFSISIQSLLLVGASSPCILLGRPGSPGSPVYHCPT